MTKTRLILILSLLFSSVLHSQRHTDTIYKSDTLVERLYIKNGKINFETYYVHDTIVSYIFYHYYKDYYSVDYYYNVKKSKLDLNNSLSKSFYLNGILKSEYKTTKGGRTQGKYKTYYPNGNPECDCQHVNGRREGIQNHHYENGQTKSLGNYKNDKREGKTSFYYENGQLKKEVVYKNGIPWETLSHFDANGNPIEKGTLKNGNGTYYMYDDKGKLENIELYKNGKLKKKNYSPKSTNS